jgi:hypothetical protein
MAIGEQSLRASVRRTLDSTTSVMVTPKGTATSLMPTALGLPIVPFARTVHREVIVSGACV